MRSNDLNIPPSEEPWKVTFSRIACQFVLPLLFPASAALVGWFADRRVSAKLEELHKKEQQITDLKENLESLPAEVDNRGVTTIKRRQLLEEAIEKEEGESTEKIQRDLDELRPLLKKRQDIYCNPLVHRSNRFEIEEQLKHLAYNKPYDKELGLYMGIQDILENDKTCGPKTNGCLMWKYFQLWETQAQLLKYKRVANQMKKIDESFTQ